MARPAAVLRLVVHPRERNPVDVHARRALCDGERIRPAADGVNAAIPFAGSGAAVDEHVRGALDDRTDRRVRTRTIELEETNLRLKEEVGDRKRAKEYRCA